MFTSMRTQAWTLAAVLFASPPVHADYVSQTVILDQSNTLKDGVAYGSVLVEAYNGVGAAGGGLNAGEVRLTYNANLVADYASLSKTFGIDHVGFNTDLAVSAGQITPPTGWKMSGNNTLSGFGQFTWGADGSAKGGSRINPATVLITGLGADATVSHFLINSQGAGKNPPSQGAVYFAMHVAGFTVKKDDDITSHWVGGSGVRVDLPPPPEGSGDLQPTPEPASILLFALGALGIAFRRRFWRARDAA